MLDTQKVLHYILYKDYFKYPDKIYLDVNKLHLGYQEQYDTNVYQVSGIQVEACLSGCSSSSIK